MIEYVDDVTGRLYVAGDASEVEAALKPHFDESVHGAIRSLARAEATGDPTVEHMVFLALAYGSVRELDARDSRAVVGVLNDYRGGDVWGDVIRRLPGELVEPDDVVHADRFILDGVRFECRESSWLAVA